MKTMLTEAHGLIEQMHLPEYLDGSHLVDEAGMLVDGPLSPPDEETDALLASVTDQRIDDRQPLLTPAMITRSVPLTPESARTTRDSREAIGKILLRQDDRLIVIAGPCSIHDPEAALEYASRLRGVQDKYGDALHLVMRTYFEKPRTTVGWKGLINDPELDETYDTNTGLVLARLILSKITAVGVPTATERLDTSTPQYLNGMIGYDAVGARNVTDQNARAYASGSSSPIGLKNAPSGNIQDAVDAVRTANMPHHFIGVDSQSRPMIVRTTGNPLAHVILRGGDTGPNYSPQDVQLTLDLLAKHNLLESLIIDASHGNSGKDHRKQMAVVESVTAQLADGQRGIKGIMVESNIHAGNQKLDPRNLSDLKYGISVTDACVDWGTTVTMLDTLSHAVRARRHSKV